ncbi:organic hydroperoxide resistance protein [Acidimangrovimonas sediminis]|uniref:organic hydroperoxide resistance protein n=1 Tax=Acidimangrovimonas sediminis TaxID=2056283 RepID=UPI000C7FD4FF|nr:organic hydroperoxide resistance protein [Acidimangrovimonas sediminis]
MQKPEKILFSTEMTAHGGRDGKVESPDGSFTLSLSVPKEIGGPGGEGSNPEQLFAAGYAACFLSALKLVARQGKVSLPAETAITAKVSLGPVEVGYALVVALTASVPGVDTAVVEKLLAEAHARCPYSNATRGNIEVTLSAG